MYSEFEGEPMGLFAFLVELPPLLWREVATCLIDFMERTAEALQELHGFGYVHLDVRVPNICFSNNTNLWQNQQ